MRQHDGPALAQDLVAIGVPCAPLLTVPAALQHPHTRHRGMAGQLPGYRGLGSPIKLSRRPPLAEGDRCWPRDSANDGSANDSNASASANASANANADPANDDGQIDR